MKIERYGIYYADLNPSIESELNKVRPVVIISQNAMNKYLDTIVVCPLTTKLHPKWRSRIKIKCNKNYSEIAVDQIRTISKKRIIKNIDKLDSSTAFNLRCLITEMYGEKQ